MSPVSYYYATLGCQAQLIIEPKENDLPRLTMAIGETKLGLRAFNRLRAYFKKHALASELRFNLMLFPRTDQSGRLSEYSYLYAFTEPNPDTVFEEGLSALGELCYVSKEEAIIGLKIWPNPEGALQKPFILSLQVSLDSLQDLPPIGSGLDLKASLKPKSLRLVVTHFKQVALPAKKKASQAQKKASTLKAKPKP